jgi:hypothetical protein
VAPVVELVAPGRRGGAHGWSGGTGEELARRRLPAGMRASLNSGVGTRFQTGSGDMTLRHGGEVGDGFGRSGARHSERRCRLRTAETAAGRRFVARAHERSCRPGTACGMPGGGSALTSGPGAEREKLTGGTSRQILFQIKNTPERK